MGLFVRGGGAVGGVVSVFGLLLVVVWYGVIGVVKIVIAVFRI